MKVIGNCDSNSEMKACNEPELWEFCGFFRALKHPQEFITETNIEGT